MLALVDQAHHSPAAVLHQFVDKQPLLALHSPDLPMPRLALQRRPGRDVDRQTAAFTVGIAPPEALGNPDKPPLRIQLSDMGLDFPIRTGVAPFSNVRPLAL